MAGHHFTVCLDRASAVSFLVISQSDGIHWCVVTDCFERSERAVLMSFCCFSFLILVNNVWIYADSCFRLFSCLAICLLRLNFNIWYYVQNFQPNVFILAMILGTAYLYHCHIRWPWLWQWVTKYVGSKIFWLHFLAHFSTDQDEIWCCVEVMQVEHPNSSLEWDFVNHGDSVLVFRVKLCMMCLWMLSGVEFDSKAFLAVSIF